MQPDALPLDPANGDIYQRLGNLTRQLHDALDALGYVPRLRESAQALPDAQSRLSYMARLTGEAAERVLGRVEAAKALLDALDARASTVQQAPEANDVPAFAQAVREQVGAVNGHLTEIMLAQDFHDLTGQVLARVVALIVQLQQQLVDLLLHAAPGAEAQPTAPELAGPTHEAEAPPDRVTSQRQADELLASLGF